MLLALSTGVFETVAAERLPKLLPLLHQAGFSYLEVGDKGAFDDKILGDLIKASKDCGIAMPNWHLIEHSPFQETAQACRKAINYMKHSMDQGHRIGATNHVLHWYHRFVDRRYDALWREIIDEWADYAKRLGIRLLMETVPDKPSNQRYVPSSEIIDFVRSYPPEVLSVCVDVNHSNLQEELADVVHLVRDRLVSLHVSDNDGHSEQHWLPGQGVIDFPSLFKSLDSIQFDGMCVLEVGKWCKQPHELSELRRLYEFGMSLLATRKPCPATPVLEK